MLTRTAICRSPSSNAGVSASRTLRGGLIGLGRIGLLDDDRELVAAEPRDGVPGSCHGLEPAADGHEQPVALRVAEPIVHRLEVVEVEEEDRGRSAAAACPREGVTEPVQEEEAVLQAGQHVVERLVTELLLEGLSLGDVPVVDDHTADGRIVEQVLGDRLEGPPRVVGVAGTEFDPGLGSARRRNVGQPAFHGRAILGMDVRANRLADPFLRPAAEDPLDGRTLVADQAILAEHDHAVRCVLDERPEALLVALHVDEQEALGRRLLLEAAVLACQHPRRATEGQPDEGDQQA